MQQLALDLYPRTRGESKVNDANAAFAWLHDMHGCNSPLAIETVNALFTRFDSDQAFERCKCVTLVDGRSAVDGWSWWELVNVIGIFTERDYHTCWDRCWAARQGWDTEKVKKLDVFAYGKGEHRFLEET